MVVVSRRVVGLVTWSVDLGSGKVRGNMEVVYTKGAWVVQRRWPCVVQRGGPGWCSGGGAVVETRMAPVPD